ncbi:MULTISPECIES: DEAD/DEAH box helicase [Kitasatospora]|uniref:DEAD/DEAH box helicase n=1 Tax=Kitasatospora TaxID=2063 RepID=UPI000525B8B3|nr:MULTISPECIES: DEAD/DEAH box helicase [Kitasatospora]
MAAGGKRSAAVVEFWRAVELFSAQTVPAPNDRERIYDLDGAGRLPWEAGHRLRQVPLPAGFVWQHVVYGGLFPLAKVRDTLMKVFGRDPESHDGRLDSQSALFALTVDDRGTVVSDSPVISTCGWAVGRALTRNVDLFGWLVGFETDEAAWRARAAELGHPPEDGELLEPEADPEEDPEGTDRKVVDAADLLAFVTGLSRAWGVEQGLEPAGLRVRSVQVRRDRAQDADQQDFLNSFIAADLARVAASLEARPPGRALAEYLTPLGERNQDLRIDLRERPQVALERVEPGRSPAGRWPAAAKHPLALSQQFAVNTIHAELVREGGVFSVNGPPGTGKTTMLRDAIADRIVERARALADLRMPSDAFLKTPLKWKSGEHTRTVYPLRPELTGFEMVVASANNGAVENISKEIPARAALAPKWRDEVDYFAEQGTRLLKGTPAWGTVAAHLGNKTNRIAFVNRLWHGKYLPDDQTLPQGPDLPPVKGKGWQETGHGLSHLLSSYRKESQTGVWRNAKERFVRALAEVDRLVAERAACAAALDGAPAALHQVEQAEQQTTAAAGLLDQWRQEQRAADSEARGAQEHLGEVAGLRQAHHARRPGLVDTVLTLGRAVRDWQGLDRQHGEREQRALEQADAARARQQRATTEAARAENAYRQSARALETVRVHEAGLREAVDRGPARWGAHVPDPADTREEARELSSPWADEEISEARTEVFLAALDLHKALVRCTARTLWGNLRAAMDVVTGSVPASVPEQARLAAWQNLFLVVPVLSTTFASLDRVFTGLGQDSLGWLFIDEAGQASPQMAVGGLWRARRAVVVGDPLQLEPVVTVPFTAQQALRRQCGAGEEWIPGWTSVQQVADRVTRYGTTLPAELPDGSTEVWVGAPLRVHRRCENPMFTVSNAIAYDGLMVNGTHYPDPYAYLPHSSWVHVGSAHSEGHWVPDEGLALHSMFEKLRDHGIDLDQEAYVISPFRAVVAGARRTSRPFMKADRVGTVHTTQGKEANVVILVLGTDPRSPGARTWAAKRPNLLNVAVSRAKRRLFVIGNHELWTQERFFTDLGELLPRYDWSAKPTGASGS